MNDPHHKPHPTAFTPTPNQNKAPLECMVLTLLTIYFVLFIVCSPTDQPITTKILLPLPGALLPYGYAIFGDYKTWATVLLTLNTALLASALFVALHP